MADIDEIEDDRAPFVETAETIVLTVPADRIDWLRGLILRACAHRCPGQVESSVNAAARAFGEEYASYLWTIRERFFETWALYDNCTRTPT